MVKKFIMTCAAVALMVCATGCSKKVQPTTRAYRSYETESIAKDPSGAVT